MLPLSVVHAGWTPPRRIAAYRRAESPPRWATTRLGHHLEVPALRTEITEIVTGLAMLGGDDLDAVLAGGRPGELREVDDPTWERLVAAREEREHGVDFLAAWNNGRAFLAADDGLRGRAPLLVEWTGGHRDPGDTVVPADLRVDHVFLVSCKYLSKVLHNASPEVLFDRCLTGGRPARSTLDWFDVVAPAQHQELYQLVRRHHASHLDLPEAVDALTPSQRRELRHAIPRAWDRECALGYERLATAAAAASAARWTEGLGGERARAAMLWRLLRLSPAPYFVLGTAAGGTLRMRVGTPWDFTRHFRLRTFEVAAQPGGQARVAWSAVVTERCSELERRVDGHVEIRWSHGRFGGPPEAKVYLDTPATEVPGYWPLV